MDYNINNILYVGSACDDKLFSEIFTKSIIKPSHAAQKFQMSFLSGFVKQEKKIFVQTVSIIPIAKLSSKEIFWNVKSEVSNGIKFNYVPFLNIPILKDLLVLMFTFLKVIRVNLNNGKSKKVVFINALNLSASIAAILACKLSRVKCVALVTDLPAFMNPVNGNLTLRLKYKIFAMFANFFISKYDAYILLTEQMNLVVNANKKPHIVVEGMVDIAVKADNPTVKNNKRVILYAGALYEKYGVKNLLDAFSRIKFDDIELHLYGVGDILVNLPIYQKSDSRIKYLGEVPNSEVVKALPQATLLINPRPTHEEFTKYSFPSKNIEYMASGTPLICTNLPGMPSEYHNHIYLLNDDSSEAIEGMLNKLLQLDNEELVLKGKKAKEFVLTEKNNVVQAKRILNLIEIFK